MSRLVRSSDRRKAKARIRKKRKGEGKIRGKADDGALFRKGRDVPPPEGGSNSDREKGGCEFCRIGYAGGKRLLLNEGKRRKEKNGKDARRQFLEKEKRKWLHLSLGKKDELR